MDRIECYRSLIIKAITESYHYRFPPTESQLDTLFLCDEKQNLFMLYQAGWMGQKPINSVIIMARIKEGKIWIEEDWTEEGIATDLLRWGVLPSDIVLAFHQPNLRPEPELLAL